MIIEIILAILIGIIAGTITGLIPGLHINLIAVLLESLAPLLPFSVQTIIAFIISMAIAHSFFDAIPSIFLGAPSEDFILSALPGHVLLHEGRGIEAVGYTVLGGLLTCIFIIVLAIPGFFLILFLDKVITQITALLLLCILSYLFLNESLHKILHALFLFCISGVLGIIVLTNASFSQPLLPLLSGFFGISLLLDSYLTTSHIPPQKEVLATFQPKESFVATIFGFCAAFLPGIGTSQLAIIASKFATEAKESFLTLTGAMNTASVIFSIITLSAIQKARNGAMVATNDLLGDITIITSLFLIAVALCAVGLSAIGTMYCARIAANILPKIPYKVCIWSICIFLITMTWYFDQVIGVLTLVCSTALGYYAIKKEIPKHYLMGCLLIPVIVFFL